MLELHALPFIAVNSDAGVPRGPAPTEAGLLRGRLAPRISAPLRHRHRARSRRHHGLAYRQRSRGRDDPQLRPDVTLVARARDADHARTLYGLGVTDAVPETAEASLQLSEAVLVDSVCRWVWSSPRSTRSATNTGSSWSSPARPSGRVRRAGASVSSTTVRASLRGAPHDLMISGFDNQRANSEKANANKRRLNAPKR